MSENPKTKTNKQKTRSDRKLPVFQAILATLTMILKTISATFSPSGKKRFLLQRQVNKTLEATEEVVTEHLRAAEPRPHHTHIPTYPH